jgi:hypothetical protein
MPRTPPPGPPPSRLVAEAALPAALGAALVLLGRPWAGWALSTLGVLLILSALAFPWLARALRRGLAIAARRVGAGLSWVLLAVFFFSVFPLGRLLRFRARDALQRRFPGGRDSYWEPARDAREPDAMERWF